MPEQRTSTCRMRMFFHDLRFCAKQIREIKEMLSKRILLTLVFVLCVATLPFVGAGCGDDSNVSGLIEVTGQVTIDGQPLTEGSVIFFPDSSQGNSGPMAGASIDTDGNYSIKTTGKAGALPGWYTVTIQLPGQDMIMGGDETKAQVPALYSSPSTTPLKKEVKAGEANTINLELKSKP